MTRHTIFFQGNGPSEVWGIKHLRKCIDTYPSRGLYQLALGHGRVAKRSKAVVCKTTIHRFESGRGLFTENESK